MTIGEVADRSGVAASALRFYEERGLINSERARSGHRRYPRPVLRRIAFIVFAQRVGLTLEEIGTRLAVPSYDRSEVTGGIVHLGVGGFHRSHQAMYVDALLNQGRARDWGITGVGLLPQDAAMRDAMAAQDCLYTLVVKQSDGSIQARVIGSMVGYLFAPDDQEAVLDRLTGPATRIVSLTITEGGYLVNQVTGEFDASAPSIAADLVPGATPSTAFGYLVAALARRRA